MEGSGSFRGRSAEVTHGSHRGQADEIPSPPVNDRPRLGECNLWLGIDDTDNLESRGTGHLVRRLLVEIESAGLAVGAAVTRHQLLVDSRIPYTSHNSSACIAARAEPTRLDRIIARASDFLEREHAAGSDPGLAVLLGEPAAGPEKAVRLAGFGLAAQREVLTSQAALALAAEQGVHLSPHGGDGGGIIGALAAVGLHLSGEDGRFLWLPNLRSLAGAVSYETLRETAAIDVARDARGDEPLAADLIDVQDWCRPVLRGGLAVLLVERSDQQGIAGDAAWKVVDRDVVRQY